MRKLLSLLAAVTAIAIFISGCDVRTAAPDTAGIQTGAALTVQAKLTASAPSATTAPFPTLPATTATLPPPPASTSTSNCDLASFILDVTYPDGTAVDAGDSFTKTWRLKNIGGCSWTTSYALVFVSGEAMGGPAVQALASNVNPGQSVDLSIALTAPDTNGAHTGNWGLRNATGVIFSHFYVQISVGGGGGGGGAFAVTHVTYSLSTWTGPGYTDCPRVTAHVTTNAAGTVTYHWTLSPNNTSSSDSLSYGAAGTKSINHDWALGSVWAGTTSWVGIYIEEPNHQDFGHLEFTTACSSP